MPQSSRSAGIRPWSIRSTMAAGSSAPPRGDLPKIRSNSGFRSLISSGSRRAPDGSRMRVDAGKHRGVFQTQLDRSITPHRQPADRPARSFCLDRESTVDQADHILDQVVFIGEPFHGIGIPAAAAVGHDDHQGNPST